MLSPIDWIDDLPKHEYSNKEKKFIKNYCLKRIFDKALHSKNYEKFSSEGINQERIKILKNRIHNEISIQNKKILIKR